MSKLTMITNHMLEKISYVFDDDAKDDNDRVGFLQVRLAAPKKKKTATRKPPKPKDNEKNLSFASCPPDVQARSDNAELKNGKSGKNSMPELSCQRQNHKNFWTQVRR